MPRRGGWWPAVLIAVVLAGCAAPATDADAPPPSAPVSAVSTQSPAASVAALAPPSSAGTPALSPEGEPVDSAQPAPSETMDASSASVPPSVPATIGAAPTDPVSSDGSPAMTQDAADPVSPTTVSEVSEAGAANAMVALLATLPVKGKAAKTGYDRSLFGPAWSDNVSVDGGHNGCDTRNDILRRDLIDIELRPDTRGCVVLTGILHDPYTRKTIDFRRGNVTSRAVQIDHVVALMDAWQKGAQQLSDEQRRSLANDPLNLQAVDGPTNAQKGAGDAATWLPPNRSYRCTYVSRQVQVKARYRLWVTSAEKDAIERVLATCGAEVDAATAVPPPTASAPVATRATAAPNASTARSRPTVAPKASVTTPTAPATTRPKATTSRPATASRAPAGCHPTSAAGNCYRAGQICAKKHHDTSGVDGRGRTIRCLDDGKVWRWTAQ